MKKIVKRILAIIVCWMLVITSCSVVYAGGFRLNKSKAQLYVGGKTTITVVGGNSKVKWLSSNSKIARVKTYEEDSLEKGTIKVIKGNNLRLMTRYYIYKIYWKKK